MRSYSQWGMFAMQGPPIFMIPDDFDIDQLALTQPGHVVWAVDVQPNPGGKGPGARCPKCSVGVDFLTEGVSSHSWCFSPECALIVEIAKTRSVSVESLQAQKSRYFLTNG